MLYRSNKVMYDRSTNSLWSQLLGEPIVGPLVGSGVKLELFAVALTTWEEWLQEHPDTLVLSLDTGYYSPSRYESEDDERSIYFGYRQNPEPIFPVWDRDDVYAAKLQVLGISIEGKHKAYPTSLLKTRRLLKGGVDGIGFVILGSDSNKDFRVYRTRGTQFSLPENAPDGLPEVLLDQRGDQWTVTDEALVRVKFPLRIREAVPTTVSFWFAWRAFHPDTEFWDSY